MSRPKLEESKNRRITVRMDEDTYTDVLELQSHTGEDFSEILRKALRFYINYIRSIRY